MWTGEVTLRAHAGMSKQPQKWRSQNGFTLIELLVTLAVLGMVAMLSLPYVSGGSGAVGLVSDARMLASRFRAAREIALATRSSTVVTIDLVRSEVHGPSDWPSSVLTAVERLSVNTARGRVTDESARFTFGPDGGSSGGVVVLKDGSRVRSVRVDWLTGAVSISEAAQ